GRGRRWPERRTGARSGARWRIGPVVARSALDDDPRTHGKVEPRERNSSSTPSTRHAVIVADGTTTQDDADDVTETLGSGACACTASGRTRIHDRGGGRPGRYHRNRRGGRHRLLGGRLRLGLGGDGLGGGFLGDGRPLLLIGGRRVPMTCDASRRRRPI